ncbi:TetR family transcriptional regulator C-terminal domain-containing protein [Marinobacterium stanieri]|uniref:TetR family transcriptional regulator C-terminal domain-containing protein n=1 Tax=Marinobacterium stanieri TaxID=49186 RepID=UPI003A95B735
MSKISEHNRSLIIQAASEIFAEKGYAATKIIDIAKHAGLPKPNIYYYFKSKENLYRSVIENVIDLIFQAELPLHGNADPATALEQYIYAKVHVSRRYPHASKVFSSEIMHGAPHLPEEIAARMKQQTLACCNKIQEWIDAGLMDPVDPQHLLFTIWASTQTYADFDWQIAMVSGKPEMSETDFDIAAHQLTQLVLKGCGVKPAEQVKTDLAV